MKRILSASVFLLISTMFVSCSSKTVNDAKLTASEKAGLFIEKKLVSEFEKNNVKIEGVDCTLEAKELGQSVTKELTDILRVKEEVNAVALSPIVSGICTYVSTTVIPKFIIDNQSKRACIRQLGASTISKIGTGLCDKIEF